MNAQYLCEYEVKIINKQKKQIKPYAESILKEWYSKNAVQLKLPQTLKFSKIEFKPDESKSAQKKWSSIDSILCIEKSDRQLLKGFTQLKKLNMVVYDIRATFIFKDAISTAIKSLIYFEFDINGDLIRAVIREKESSPFTEKYYYE